MATKTIINCMENSITQSHQGISIIIDQHTNEQQVCDTSSNSNIIKIQHSNEQSLPQHLTLNNRNNNGKNNKTLIDINRNNDQQNDETKNEHVLQINCSTTSNETSRQINEMLENTIQTGINKLEYNGVLTERGNDDDNEVQRKREQILLNLAKHGNNKENEEILTKYCAQQRVEEDYEESGQTASQQQQKQQKENTQQQQVNNGNSNSKNRENGQNFKLKLTNHQNNNNNNNDEEHKDDNERQLHNNDDHDDEYTKTPHHNEVTNRQDDNDEYSSSSGITSGSGSSSGGLVQREVVDFSHGKRSLNEENSNSLLTKADASTCTKSTTLLTINANALKVATQKNDLNNFESSLTNDKKINHVVKIQIKPNNQNNLNNSNSNTLTENKQITVVKIENLQQEFTTTTTTPNTTKQNNKENIASENIENKENLKENTLLPKQKTTSVTLSQLNDPTKMVQQPSTNNAATVTVVSNSNGNGNGNGNGNLSNGSNTSGTVIASTGTTVTELNVSNPNNYLYYMMSSGQFSPCDTLDSGTGSDLESNGQLQQSSPNLQTKKSSNSSSCSTSSTSSASNNNSLAPLELHLKTTKIRVANSSNSLEMQQRQCSFTDSEESEASSLSCDSLHSNEFLRQSSTSPIQIKSTSISGTKKIQSFLPDSLLREIKNLKFSTNDYEAENEEEDDILPTLKSENSKNDLYEPLSNQDYIKSHEFIQSRKNLNNLPPNMSSSLKRASLPSKTFVLNTEDGTFIDTKMNSMPRTYEADKYYNFHVNEHDNFRSFGNNGSMTSLASNGGSGGGDSLSISDYETKSLQDDVFAGYRDLRCGSNTSTIRSSKGTVRGVKNRVRNGIATFLQLQQPNIKNYKEKDSGKVVLYTTSMGIIRDTYAKCSNVKQILRTLLVKFEERDVFMSVEYQQEIKERMHSDVIKVPQLYVEGQHIGDADTVERLNESGELRQLLKPYKSISTTYTCQTCGGYRLLPCPSCNGSKKSVHRNHFTAEFVALKCMNCDEVGLVKCHNC